MDYSNNDIKFAKLRRKSKLKYLNIIKKIGGVLIIVMGILLLTNKLTIFL